MNARTLISILVLSVSVPGFSQLTIGAELRPRAMFDNGYSAPVPADSPPRLYVTQRTRLNAGFKTGKFETYLSVQDVRFWGGDNQFKAGGAFGSTASMSLHQAWFIAKPAQWFSLKVGRQQLVYDDQRILGSRGWNDTQVSYDAVLARAGNASHRVELALSWNAESSQEVALSPLKFKTLDFVRYQHTMEKLSWSLITLITGNYVGTTGDEVWYRATWGANTVYTGKAVQGRASLYYQHHLNLAGGELSALCGNVNIGVPVIPDRMLWFLGMEYLSGQDGMDSGTGRTNHVFDRLYGNRHTWYGYMDYFNTTPAQGLEDYMVKGEFRIGESLVLYTDYHYFRLAAPMPDPENPTQEASRHLAHELDLTLNWTISDQAALQAGYSVMLPGTSLEIIKNVADTPIRLPRFAYVMITLKPSFTLN
ncbi:MAG: alginate export family protein [Bacteroidota bacterium]